MENKMSMKICQVCEFSKWIQKNEIEMLKGFRSAANWDALRDAKKALEDFEIFFGHNIKVHQKECKE